MFEDERAEKIREIKARVQNLVGIRVIMTKLLGQIVEFRQEVIDNDEFIWNNPGDLNSLNNRLLEEKQAIQQIVDDLP